jgi:hypothetical protein
MKLETFEIAFLSLICLATGFLITSCGYEIFVVSKIRQEAVQKGYAIWEVEPRYGQTKFKFK